MRKEFGKWLMDIAKYIATAIILTSIFGDIKQKWLFMQEVQSLSCLHCALDFGWCEIKKKGVKYGSIIYVWTCVGNRYCRRTVFLETR